MGLVAILTCGWIPKFTAEWVLDQVATSLSGVEHAFKRPH